MRTKLQEGCSNATPADNAVSSSDDDDYDVAHLMRRMRDPAGGIVLRDRYFESTKVSQSFVAHQVLDWLTSQQICPTRLAAKDLAQTLLRSGHISRYAADPKAVFGSASAMLRDDELLVFPRDGTAAQSSEAQSETAVLRAQVEALAMRVHELANMREAISSLRLRQCKDFESSVSDQMWWFTAIITALALSLLQALLGEALRMGTWLGLLGEGLAVSALMLGVWRLFRRVRHKRGHFEDVDAVGQVRALPSLKSRRVIAAAEGSEATRIEMSRIRAQTQQLKRRRLSTFVASLDDSLPAEEKATKVAVGQQNLLFPPLDQQEGVTEHCWSIPDANLFRVRGPSYPTDGVKVRGGTSTFRTAAVEFYKVDAKTDHVAVRPGAACWCVPMRLRVRAILDLSRC